MIPNKIVTIFVSIILAVGALYLGILTWNAVKAHNYIGTAPQEKHSIAITGEGKVTGVPDVAKVQLGYDVEKKTVTEAQKDSTEKMNAIIKKLKDDFKIDAKDIQTVNYSISPMYDYSNNGKQTLRGYQVSQSIGVKVRELNKVSQILELAGSAGLNQIGGLSFEIDEPEKLKQEAREIALKQAKEKAEALAKIAGVKLGKVVSFSEFGNEPGPLYGGYGALKADGMGGGGAPEVQAGSAEIKITATVEYEIL